MNKFKCISSNKEESKIIFVMLLIVLFYVKLDKCIILILIYEEKMRYVLFNL